MSQIEMSRLIYKDHRLFHESSLIVLRFLLFREIRRLVIHLRCLFNEHLTMTTRLIVCQFKLATNLLDIEASRAKFCEKSFYRRIVILRLVEKSKSSMQVRLIFFRFKVLLPNMECIFNARSRVQIFREILKKHQSSSRRE